MGIVIVGCGSLAREVARSFAALPEDERRGVPVENLWYWSEQQREPTPTGRAHYRPTCDDDVLVAIGKNSVRKRLMTETIRPHDSGCGLGIPSLLSRPPCEHKSPAFGVDHWLTIVDPTAIVRDVTGLGCYVAARAFIGPDVEIGKGVIVNVAATVATDCKLGDFSWLSPQVNLCGGVKIGEGVFLGAGAIVTPRVKIGEWSVIDAGAVVTRDVPPRTRVYGPTTVAAKHNLNHVGMLADGGFWMPQRPLRPEELA